MYIFLYMLIYIIYNPYIYTTHIYIYIYIYIHNKNAVLYVQLQRISIQEDIIDINTEKVIYFVKAKALNIQVL